MQLTIEKIYPAMESRDSAAKGRRRRRAGTESCLLFAVLGRKLQEGKIFLGHGAIEKGKIRTYVL